jgi:putative copper resistance protein D
MLEIIAYFARWSQVTANLILFGSSFFLVIAGSRKVLSEAPWIPRVERMFPWLALLVLLGLTGLLATTTGSATGDEANAWTPKAWLQFIHNTQVGVIAFIRILLAVLLFAVVVYTLLKPRSRRRYAFLAFTAALPLIAGAFMSHSSADEMSFAAIAPFVLHLLFAGMWFGALPVFLLILLTNHRETDKDQRLANISNLETFSTIALPVMLLLMLTGLIVTDRMIGSYYHTLVASPYGWLLNFKIALLAVILVIAYKARNKWLPLLAQSTESNDLGHSGNSRITESSLHFRKWVRIEFLLALLLILFATILANTLPGKHAIIDDWPFPFRFSLDANREETGVEEMFWLGMALFAVAIFMIWISLKYEWQWKKAVLASSILIIAAMAVALPPITIEAYPETYMKPEVPLDALSISRGAQLFAGHCADCHGPQGKGNGRLADTLSTPPTDLLTEPHTARHTVGNFYHQIIYGVPDTNMPGFRDKLTDEDVWDVVNFLHTLSRGFDARLLGSMILPEMPAVGAPVFYYSANDGSSGDLKDFRYQQNVVLILFSWPQSQPRLQQLRHVYERVNNEYNTAFLAVPMQQLSEQELQTISELVPFPVVTDGWLEISDTYRLYRRVRTVPDLNGTGLKPEHIEFIIDRFGYLRARWNSQFEGFGYQNINALTQQLGLLNAEGEIMPPPGEHAH